MATLLLRLEGPMQSWGAGSHFDIRDTATEPTKSGVIGLLCAALGIDRGDAEGLRPLTLLRMGVRVDRPGMTLQDYHTAQLVLKKRGATVFDTAQTWRDYLSDASFLVGLEGSDESLLKRAHQALRAPHWPLCLGRKCYSPSSPIHIRDGLRSEPLAEALRGWPMADRGVANPAFILEAVDGRGERRQDVPLGAFSERRFGVRYVVLTCLEASAGDP